jgi:zinc transporter 1/2/3
MKFASNTLQLLAPAADALTNPCLTGPITEYDWAEGIALMTIFTMFFIELMASRFDIFGEQAHDLEALDPSKDLIRESGKYADTKTSIQKGSKQHLLFTCCEVSAKPEQYLYSALYDI